MFATNYFHTFCCSHVPREEADHAVMVPSMVIGLDEHADASAFLFDTTKLEHGDASLQKEGRDLADCSTTSGSVSDSEMLPLGCARDFDDHGGINRIKASSFAWSNVMTRCRVPTIDDALDISSLVHPRSCNRATKLRVANPPQLVMVQSPSCLRAYNGVYELCPGETANGHELWKHRTAEFWLYSCKKGRWCIGGKDVAADRFERESGFLVQTLPHEGAMPDEVQCVWQRWDKSQGCFYKDSAIFVQTMY